jgi:hypothetical protein
VKSERYKIQLSAETSLFLLLSRVKPAPVALKQAQTLVDSGVNWDSLIAESGRHGTSGLIYKNLLGFEDIPQNVLDRLGNAYNLTLRRNVGLASETDRLTDGLNARDIEVIPLKGPLTSEIIFGDLGAYPSSDIDLLIKVEDIDRAKEYLESDGYRLNDSCFDTCRNFYIEELYHISLSNGQYTIEPHWNLFFRYFTAPPDFWWEESITLHSEDHDYQWLSPEKNILYNSFRTFFKVFDQLRFLVMLSEIIRYHTDEIDWEKLFHYAKTYKFENVLRITLKLSHELLGAEVPGSCIALKQPRAKVLYRLIRKMALEGNSDRTLNKILLASLRDDFFGFLRVMLRRVFPSMGEIVSRYRLPDHSAKAVAYYVLNPILLLLQKQVKK